MLIVFVAVLGVPLWLCTLAIVVLLVRNRSLRRRGGDVPVRMRASPKKRWWRGHALWTHDVLPFHASHAGWSLSLLGSTGADLHVATEEGRKKLRRLGDHPVVARVSIDGGENVEAAASAAHPRSLMGPFAGPQAHRLALADLPQTATERSE